MVMFLLLSPLSLISSLVDASEYWTSLYSIIYAIVHALNAIRSAFLASIASEFVFEFVCACTFVNERTLFAMIWWWKRTEKRWRANIYTSYRWQEQWTNCFEIRAFNVCIAMCDTHTRKCKIKIESQSNATKSIAAKSI